MAEIFSVSVFAACTALHKILRAIAKQKGQFLPLPEDIVDTKRTFYDDAHFAGVIGAIHCTHIRIIRPNRENATAFANKKQFSYINVQAVRDTYAFITLTS